MLGRANSPDEDFMNIWVLSRNFEFKDGKLARAIAATFASARPKFQQSHQTALRPLCEDPPDRAVEFFRGRREF